MAQIVDLDALIDQYEANLLAQAGAKQAAQQSAAELDLQKLTEFGYKKPEIMDYRRRPGSELLPVIEEGRSRDRAIRAGILADDPYFIEKYLPTAPAKVKAEFTGVDFTGGAEGDSIRQISLLPADVAANPDYVQRVIQTNYAELYDIPRTYDYNVRVEPNTGDMIFNDPRNKNQPTIVNPPGIDKGDLLAFAEPLVAEVGAGIAGGLAGGVLTGGNPVGIGGGALTAETLAAYLWRLQNLNYLDEKGFLPPNYDINTRALKDAGMTALFSLGGVGVFKLVKMAFGATNPGRTFPINEKEFLESYNKVFSGQTGEITEDVTAMTTPQVLMAGREQGVAVVRSQPEGAEQALRSEAEKPGQFGEDLRVKYAAQEAEGIAGVQAPFEAQQITRDLVGEETGAAARSVRGQEFRDVAEQALETSPRMQEVEQQIVDLNLRSDQLFQDLTEGSLDPATAGAGIRSAFQQAKDGAAELVDDAYDQAATAAGFKGNVKPYNYSRLGKSVKRMANIVRQQAFPDARDAARLQNVLTSIKSGVNKPHSVFVRDLSELRSIIRQQRELGKNVDDLVTIRDDLLKVRKDALREKGGPQALAKFEAAESAYRQLQEDFNNKTIKNMLKLQSISADKYAQGDKQAYEGFTNFLRSNITRREDGTLDSPEFINQVLLDPENITGLESLKAGLREEFLNKVAIQKDGVLQPRSPVAYQNFMNRNGNILQKFFTEDEMANFSSAESFINNFRKEQLALARTRDQIAGSTNLRPIADNLNKPELIFSQTWKPGEITATRELYDAVTTHGSQELIDSYKANIFKDFIQKTEIAGVGGKKSFSGDRIENYLDSHGDALRVWFGNDFVKQLGDIGQKIKPFDNVGIAKLSEEDAFILNSLNSLARAYVGLFTTPGRVLTAVKTIYGGKAQRRQLDLLANPDKLYKTIMSNRFQKNPVVRGAVRELGRVFYREEFDQPETEAEVTAEESMIFGPGFQTNFNRGGHVVKNLSPLKYDFGRR